MKRGPHHGRYILDGKIPVPCDDLLTWGRWIEDHHDDCVVRQEDVGPYWISTVFLGLDHSWIDNDLPRLFETMIFRNANAEDRERYQEGPFRCPNHLLVDDSPVSRTPTWELALEAHAEAIVWAKEQLT